jgi:hypothetical protein
MEYSRFFLDRKLLVRILLKLAARRYPKLAYRLHDSLNSGPITAEKIAETYNEPAKRYALERRIETMCALPIGTVYIHCPVRNTSMKVAHALVVGSDLTKVSHLRMVTDVYGGADELKPNEKEIVAIEDMYKSIWRFHIYVDAAHADRKKIVEMVACTEIGFPNDPLLSNEIDNDPFSFSDGNIFDQLKNYEKEFVTIFYPTYCES